MDIKGQFEPTALEIKGKEVRRGKANYIFKHIEVYLQPVKEKIISKSLKYFNITCIYVTGLKFVITDLFCTYVYQKVSRLEVLETSDRFSQLKSVCVSEGI